MQGWILTGEALDKLLSYLDPVRDEAGSKYEKIRRGLVKFFDWRGCTHSEDLADETINRVAKSLDEGKEVWAKEPAAYFHGFAQNVLREQWDKKRPADLEDIPEYRHPAAKTDAPFQAQTDAEQDRVYNCLDRCTYTLPADHRDLIVNYYHGETSVKIAKRKELASSLGIPLNALRIRAHRIREKLETCVTQCVTGEM
jgi:RNA polymerase sigma factor (sigma-70 family)